MLGVTLTICLSVMMSEVSYAGAGSLYAIKVLRCHGMNEEELRLVYKSVVLAKLMYASPAWWGFATAADKNALKLLFSEE